MSLILQSSGGGQITIQEPATASNFTATLPATTGTLVVTGTTPTLNGITFPATQVPSADANTLDDYEEGTWTPVPTSQNGTLTAYTSSGRYTKVGNLVTVTGQFAITTAGTASGFVRIDGYPFANNVIYDAMGSAREGASSGSQYQSLLLLGQTYGYIFGNNNAAIVWTNSYQYYWSLTYFI